MAAGSRLSGHLFEESPDSLKRRCRVTPGQGNLTESATEMKPPRQTGGSPKGTLRGKDETVG